jgi:hypothetical protein
VSSKRPNLKKEHVNFVAQLRDNGVVLEDAVEQFLQKYPVFAAYNQLWLEETIGEILDDEYVGDAAAAPKEDDDDEDGDDGGRPRKSAKSTTDESDDVLSLQDPSERLKFAEEMLKAERDKFEPDIKVIDTCMRMIERAASHRNQFGLVKSVTYEDFIKNIIERERTFPVVGARRRIKTGDEDSL